jgi:hypothetical protein
VADAPRYDACLPWLSSGHVCEEATQHDLPVCKRQIHTTDTPPTTHSHTHVRSTHQKREEGAPPVPAPHLQLKDALYLLVVHVHRAVPLPQSLGRGRLLPVCQVEGTEALCQGGVGLLLLQKLRWEGVLLLHGRPHHADRRRRAHERHAMHAVGGRERAAEGAGLHGATPREPRGVWAAGGGAHHHPRVHAGGRGAHEDRRRGLEAGGQLLLLLVGVEGVPQPGPGHGGGHWGAAAGALHGGKLHGARTREGHVWLLCLLLLLLCLLLLGGARRGSRASVGRRRRLLCLLWLRCSLAKQLGLQIFG